MLSLARRICHLTSHQVTWGHIQVTSRDVSVFERGIPYSTVEANFILRFRWRREMCATYSTVSGARGHVDNVLNATPNPEEYSTPHSQKPRIHLLTLPCRPHSTICILQCSGSCPVQPNTAQHCIPVGPYIIGLVQAIPEFPFIVKMPQMLLLFFCGSRRPKLCQCHKGHTPSRSIHK